MAAVVEEKEWKTIHLGEIAEFRNGLNFTKSNFGSGLKVIGVRDFQDYSVPRYEALEEINPTGIAYEDSLLRNNDILFVRSNGNRDLIGRSLFITDLVGNVSHSGFTIRLRFMSKKVSPRFYAYLFRTPIIRRTLSAYGGGTNINNLNQRILAELQVFLPPVEIQQKIAAILSAYDDLIKNNLRRIKILEEMAQNLYREWFIKFRFPGHQKVNMTNSPLGKIPGGWEVETLDDVLATLESGSRPKGGIDPEARGVPSVGAENIIGLGQYDYSKEKFVTREFFDNMNRGHIQGGDVLLYKDGAQIGRKSMFRDEFPHAECCINEHVFIMRTNGRCSQNYLFFWLDQPEMTQNIINLNANAAQPGINQSGVRGLPILLPPTPLLENAEQILEPLLGALFNYAKRNNILRQTRDLLLPKLISGEQDVSDLDIRTQDIPA